MVWDLIKSALRFTFCRKANRSEEASKLCIQLSAWLTTRDADHLADFFDSLHSAEIDRLIDQRPEPRDEDLEVVELWTAYQ